MSMLMRRRVGFGAAGGDFSPATRNWLNAVEAADNDFLEPAIREIMGTYADYRIPLGGGCCVLRGARTLAGALVPLVGPAPINFDFDALDYNRVTGLKANGTTQYLDTGFRSGGALTNDNHMAVFAHTPSVKPFTCYAGMVTSGNLAVQIFRNSVVEGIFIDNGASVTDSLLPNRDTTGFIATGRQNASECRIRAAGSEGVRTQANGVSAANKILVFARGEDADTIDTFVNADARLSFYSVAPFTDLAPLDSATTTYMDAIVTALT